MSGSMVLLAIRLRLAGAHRSLACVLNMERVYFDASFLPDSETREYSPSNYLAARCLPRAFHKKPHEFLPCSQVSVDVAERSSRSHI